VCVRGCDTRRERANAGSSHRGLYLFLSSSRNAAPALLGPESAAVRKWRARQQPNEEYLFHENALTFFRCLGSTITAFAQLFLEPFDLLFAAVC
jgi:hypothetical protein